MTKAALREKRRAERIARRKRNRLIWGLIILAALAGIAFLVFNEQFNKPDTADLIGGPNKLTDAAVTTASGLIFEDKLVGEGDAAQVGDTIRVFYTGWLSDGTVFDSNMEDPQPIEFTLQEGSLIQGWVEGIPGMKVGGQRLLVIPPDLAYGAAGNASIPPNSTLTFLVVLAGIK
jgi:FKBP-type peptidyl-prolyl cis-trans isomerase